MGLLCIYMSHLMPALNGSCSCPPMGRDLGPNPARYIGPCRSDTKIYRADPSGPAQMYTYIRVSLGYKREDTHMVEDKSHRQAQASLGTDTHIDF